MSDVTRVYFDHAATTPLEPLVLEAMLPLLRGEYGNPSSIYRTGRSARRALDQARDTVAAAIGARSSREIMFTSGGTEADNLALKGVAWAARDSDRRHIVTTAIEHHAVLYAARFLEQEGFRVTYVPPTKDGVVDVEAVAAAVTDSTLLVSVMHANNETGAIQPIAEIARVAKARGALFHTDAVQSVGHLPVNVAELGCDLLSMAAHKFYGPKGVGVLYVRRGVLIEPLLHGGGQEHERRAGTENVAGVVGMARALELALSDMDARATRVEQLRDQLWSGLQQRIEGLRLNGPAHRLPGHLNLSVDGVDGESLLLNLDMAGIEASSGSACTSGSLEASHVLLAMGLGREEALSSVRFSLGKGNKEEDVTLAIEAMADIVGRLRTRKTVWKKPPMDG